MLWSRCRGSNDMTGSTGQQSWVRVPTPLLGAPRGRSWHEMLGRSSRLDLASQELGIIASI